MGRQVTMDQERWRAVRELFEAARLLQADERAAFLGEACGDDAELRREVETLLGYEGGSGDAIANVIGEAAVEVGGPVLEIGQRLGKYRILDRLEEGGMGEVYEALDPELERRVALKVLPRRGAVDPGGIRRFRREAKALAALNHSNIVTIYSVEQEDGIDFLTMERVEGESLDRLIAAEGLPFERLLDLALPLLNALAAAHEKGIVHRDLKPANVMVTADGALKVLDFGLAKLQRQESARLSAASTERLTQAGITLGTVPYMSPEQVEGRKVDHRSDLFSFGVLLYEAASGRRPFTGASAAALMSSILRDEPPGLAELRPDLPEGLGQIVRRCLEKDPSRRYQSAAELCRDLESLQRQPQRSIGPFGRLVPGALHSRRRLLLAGGIVVALVLAVAVVLLRPRPPAAGGGPQIESLAVLPLANLSGDPEQQYFADGMTEALITELSKIGALKVISRTSAMRYKGTDKSLPEIARELGVEGVVEGSVLRVEERVRIAAQLIHAETDRHLWAESYERDLADILALQGEVARAIAGEVRVTLTPEEERRLSSARPVEPQAANLYLTGRYMWNRFTPPDLLNAIANYQRAIQVDPQFAPAYAGLASAHQILANLGVEEPQRAYGAAKGATAEALRLDSSLAEAHATAGWTALQYDRDWPTAEREFRRALELNPGDPQPRVGLGFYLEIMGRGGEGEAEMRRALELDPLSPLIQTNLCEFLFFARRFQEAMEQCQGALELDPGFIYAHFELALIHYRQGEVDRAAQAALATMARFGFPPEILAAREETYREGGPVALWRTELEQIQGARERGIPVSSHYLALVSLRAGDHETALRWLENAVDERTPQAIFLGLDPTFDPLRDDPRFQDLLQRLQLPPGAPGRTRKAS